MCYMLSVWYFFLYHSLYLQIYFFIDDDVSRGSTLATECRFRFCFVIVNNKYLLFGTRYLIYHITIADPYLFCPPVLSPMERRRSSIPAGTHARSRWNVLHCGRAKMLRLGPFSGLSILPKKRTTSLDLRSNPQRNRRTLAAMATTLKLSATTASVSSLLQTSKRSTSASGKWNSSSTLTLKRESVKFQRLVVRAGEGVEVDVKEAGQKGDILPSGEWAENFSLLNYEDLSKHYEPMLFKPEVCLCSLGSQYGRVFCL